MKITKKSLKAALKAQDVFVNKVFKNQSDFDKAFEGVEDLIIDCTEIPIQRPDNQEEQRGYYSGKKQHTVKMLMISDSKKPILYVGKLWSGSIHDITIFKNEFSWINFRGKPTHVDLRFQGIEGVICNAWVVKPPKKPKGKLLGDFEKSISGVQRQNIFKI